ncbi:MAG: hypothetical protein K2Q28_06420 [Hyphomicrobium sp.]|nr:hypothetical protein [Hyphomicrobium sp.]
MRGSVGLVWYGKSLAVFHILIMMHHIRHLAVPFALAVPIYAAGADEVCIEDWSTAVPVVRSEGLASVEAVTALARKRLKGDVVKVTLCMQGQTYVYRLLMRGRDGRHTRIIVDANRPFSR